jgi:hypothetical protein
VFDHFDRYGDTSAQRLFPCAFVARVQRLSGLGYLDLGSLLALAVLAIRERRRAQLARDLGLGLVAVDTDQPEVVEVLDRTVLEDRRDLVALVLVLAVRIVFGVGLLDATAVAASVVPRGHPPLQRA